MAKPFSFGWRLALPFCLCLGLVACDLGGTASYPVARQRHQGAPRYTQPASAFGANGVQDSASATESTRVGVDNRLWRAALETVSFMPLVSIDATSGVIITDWYAAPNAPNQRQKVNVYVLGRELRAESLRVSVFRQQRGSDGSWADAPSPGDVGTEFENEILTRAQKISAIGDSGAGPQFTQVLLATVS